MFRGERGIEALGLQAEQSGGGTSSASHGRERFESGFPRYQTNGSKDSFDEEPLFSDRRIGVNENSNEAAEQSEQTEQQESYPPILSPALRFSSSKANLMMHNLTGAHEGFGERGKEGEFNADTDTNAADGAVVVMERSFRYAVGKRGRSNDSSRERERERENEREREKSNVGDRTVPKSLSSACRQPSFPATTFCDTQTHALPAVSTPSFYQPSSAAVPPGSSRAGSTFASSRNARRTSIGTMNLSSSSSSSSSSYSSSSSNASAISPGVNGRYSTINSPAQLQNGDRVYLSPTRVESARLYSASSSSSSSSSPASSITSFSIHPYNSSSVSSGSSATTTTTVALHAYPPRPSSTAQSLTKSRRLAGQSSQQYPSSSSSSTSSSYRAHQQQNNSHGEVEGSKQPLEYIPPLPLDFSLIQGDHVNDDAEQARVEHIPQRKQELVEVYRTTPHLQSAGAIELSASSCSSFTSHSSDNHINTNITSTSSLPPSDRTSLSNSLNSTPSAPVHDAANETVGFVEGVEEEEVCKRGEEECTEVAKDEAGDECVVEEEGVG
ncbi:uncharacterized protein MONOS_17072 [Monocercomonoides exilis]|uniref:uncharacterized protein n=1 Tax=Monocercomonoides exilis TaxID=2049356 RepID=UPI0035594016|nr:hypothetical protein MONOS_17072 [Monocercomonoides exilis]